jgi:hypothetical protein
MRSEEAPVSGLMIFRPCQFCPTSSFSTMSTENSLDVFDHVNSVVGVSLFRPCQFQIIVFDMVSKLQPAVNLSLPTMARTKDTARKRVSKPPPTANTACTPTPNTRPSRISAPPSGGLKGPWKHHLAKPAKKRRPANSPAKYHNPATLSQPSSSKPSPASALKPHPPSFRTTTTIPEQLFPESDNSDPDV